MKPLRRPFLRRARELGLGLALLCAAAVQGADGPDVAASKKDLCVTNGKVKADAAGQWEVDSSSSRFVVKNVDDNYASVRFEYLGPTQDVSLLESGTLRRQVGLKLKAEDSCNLVYVMWRIEPETDIEVLVKRNAGKSSHAACGVKGYKAIPAKFEKPVAKIETGKPRTLAAGFENGNLVVRIDGDVVWKGDPGPAARSMTGYAGFRTDNARVRLSYSGRAVPTEQVATRGPRPSVACH